MKKIFITLLFCVFAYVYSMYFTGLQADNLATKSQEFKNASAGNCTDQNFCAIPRDQNINVSLPGIKE